MSHDSDACIHYSAVEWMAGVNLWSDFTYGSTNVGIFIITGLQGPSVAKLSVLGPIEVLTTSSMPVYLRSLSNAWS